MNTKRQQMFLDALRNNSKLDAFDAADAAIQGAPAADALPAIGSGLVGNPNYSSTFNLKFLTFYFTLTAGTYTNIAAAALNAGLKNQLPFFVFGNNDFDSGFKKIKGSFPLNSNWGYGTPFIYGKDEGNALGLDATVLGYLETGDLVLPFTSALPGAGTTTLALNVVRCPEIAYGTLLGEIASDTFVLGGIRYFLSDSTKVSQFSNQIQFNNLSIFGKFDNDKLTPNDYKKPTQYQDGIVDVPVPIQFGGVDKHKSWGFYSNYDVVDQSWTLFAPRVRKLSAQ